jgi:deazaflavin-dependent oxidoreductase (nitroreductase family)
MPLPRSVALFNRRVTNKILGRFADIMPGFGVLYHVGRKSGRVFSTPISCFRDGSDVIICLTYGPQTDWVKNVIAAGGCEVVMRGKRLRLTNPRVYRDAARPWAPAFARFILSRVDAQDNLRLTLVA